MGLIYYKLDYIQAYDPTFSWKLLLAAEAKVIKKEEDWVMPPLQYSLDKAREEGMLKGERKGIQTVVLKMLKSGFDIQTVSKCTGLSKAELSKSLKSKNLKNGS